MINLLDNLEIAKLAAITAGQYLKRNFYKNHKIILDDGRDIKLKIDQDTEAIILECINKNSEIPILSEESGVSDILGDTYWIVDPLDGSSNYLRGIDTCAVSIALFHKNKSILGVINDFMNDDLYYATKGKGAFCNNSKLKVSDIKNSKQGTIMTGIPSKKEYTNEEFIQILNLFQLWKKVRMIGSAAISNLYVATGKADCYKEKDTFIWDVAAGAIIVEEAGGLSTLTEIQSDYRVSAVFTNGKVN